MGGGSSQTIEQTFNMDVLNETIFTQITNNQASVSSVMENVQTLEVVLGNIGEGCTINAGQTIDATSVSSSELTAKTIAETKSAVENQLTSEAEAAADKATQLGNFQFGDKQNVSQEVNMAVKTIVDNTFETNNIAEVTSRVVNVQDGKYTIGNCTGGTVNIGQDITASLMATAITDTLTSAIADNEVLNQLHAASVAEVTSFAGGFAEVIDSILAGGQIVSIISALCIGLIIMMVVAKGGKKLKGGGRGRGA